MYRSSFGYSLRARDLDVSDDTEISSKFQLVDFRPETFTTLLSIILHISSKTHEPISPNASYDSNTLAYIVLACLRILRTNLFQLLSHVDSSRLTIRNHAHNKNGSECKEGDSLSAAQDTTDREVELRAVLSVVHVCILRIMDDPPLGIWSPHVREEAAAVLITGLEVFYPSAQDQFMLLLTLMGTFHSSRGAPTCLIARKSLLPLLVEKLSEDNIVSRLVSRTVDDSDYFLSILDEHTMMTPRDISHQINTKETSSATRQAYTIIAVVREMTNQLVIYSKYMVRDALSDFSMESGSYKTLFDDCLNQVRLSDDIVWTYVHFLQSLFKYILSWAGVTRKNQEQVTENQPQQSHTACQQESSAAMYCLIHTAIAVFQASYTLLKEALPGLMNETDARSHSIFECSNTLPKDHFGCCSPMSTSSVDSTGPLNQSEDLTQDCTEDEKLSRMNAAVGQQNRFLRCVGVLLSKSPIIGEILPPFSTALLLFTSDSKFAWHFLSQASRMLYVLDVFNSAMRVCFVSTNTLETASGHQRNISASSCLPTQSVSSASISVPVPVPVSSIPKSRSNGVSANMAEKLNTSNQNAKEIKSCSIDSSWNMAMAVDLERTLASLCGKMASTLLSTNHDDQQYKSRSKDQFGNDVSQKFSSISARSVLSSVLFSQGLESGIVKSRKLGFGPIPSISDSFVPVYVEQSGAALEESDSKLKSSSIPAKPPINSKFPNRPHPRTKHAKHKEVMVVDPNTQVVEKPNMLDSYCVTEREKLRFLKIIVSRKREWHVFRRCMDAYLSKISPQFRMSLLQSNSSQYGGSTDHVMVDRSLAAVVASLLKHSECVVEAILFVRLLCRMQSYKQYRNKDISQSDQNKELVDVNQDNEYKDMKKIEVELGTDNINSECKANLDFQHQTELTEDVEEKDGFGDDEECDLEIEDDEAWAETNIKPSLSLVALWRLTQDIRSYLYRRRAELQREENINAQECSPPVQGVDSDVSLHEKATLVTDEAELETKSTKMKDPFQDLCQLVRARSVLLLKFRCSSCSCLCCTIRGTNKQSTTVSHTCATLYETLGSTSQWLSYKNYAQCCFQEKEVSRDCKISQRWKSLLWTVRIGLTWCKQSRLRKQLELHVRHPMFTSSLSSSPVKHTIQFVLYGLDTAKSSIADIQKQNNEMPNERSNFAVVDSIEIVEAIMVESKKRYLTAIQRSEGLNCVRKLLCILNESACRIDLLFPVVQVLRRRSYYLDDLDGVSPFILERVRSSLWLLLKYVQSSIVEVRVRELMGFALNPSNHGPTSSAPLEKKRSLSVPNSFLSQSSTSLVSSPPTLMSANNGNTNGANPSLTLSKERSLLIAISLWTMSLQAPDLPALARSNLLQLLHDISKVTSRSLSQHGSQTPERSSITLSHSSPFSSSSMSNAQRKDVMRLKKLRTITSMLLRFLLKQVALQLINIPAFPESNHSNLSTNGIQSSSRSIVETLLCSKSTPWLGKYLSSRTLDRSRVEHLSYSAMRPIIDLIATELDGAMSEILSPEMLFVLHTNVGGTSGCGDENHDYDSDCICDYDVMSQVESDERKNDANLIEENHGLGLKHKNIVKKSEFSTPTRVARSESDSCALESDILHTSTSLTSPDTVDGDFCTPLRSPLKKRMDRRNQEIVGGPRRFVNMEDGIFLPADQVITNPKGGPDFSITLWLMLTQDSTGKQRVVFFRGTALERIPALLLREKERRLELQFMCGNATEKPLSKTILPLHKWVHIAVVCEGQKVRLYVNGALDCEKTIGFAAGKSSFASRIPLFVGTVPQDLAPTELTNLSGLEGTIAHLCFHSRAISPIHIRIMCDQGPPEDSTVPDSSCFQLLILLQSIAQSPLGCAMIATKRWLKKVVALLTATTSIRVQLSALRVLVSILQNVKPSTLACVLRSLGCIPQIQDISKEFYASNCVSYDEVLCVQFLLGLVHGRGWFHFGKSNILDTEVTPNALEEHINPVTNLYFPSSISSTDFGMTGGMFHALTSDAVSMIRQLMICPTWKKVITWMIETSLGSLSHWFTHNVKQNLRENVDSKAAIDPKQVDGMDSFVCSNASSFISPSLALSALDVLGGLCDGIRIGASVYVMSGDDLATVIAYEEAATSAYVVLQNPSQRDTRMGQSIGSLSPNNGKKDSLADQQNGDASVRAMLLNTEELSPAHDSWLNLLCGELSDYLCSSEFSSQLLSMLQNLLVHSKILKLSHDGVTQSEKSGEIPQIVDESNINDITQNGETCFHSHEKHATNLASGCKKNHPDENKEREMCAGGSHTCMGHIFEMPKNPWSWYPIQIEKTHLSSPPSGCDQVSTELNQLLIAGALSRGLKSLHHFLNQDQWVKRVVSSGLLESLAHFATQPNIHEFVTLHEIEERLFALRKRFYRAWKEPCVSSILQDCKQCGSNDQSTCHLAFVCAYCGVRVAGDETINRNSKDVMCSHVYKHHFSDLECGSPCTLCSGTIITSHTRNQGSTLEGKDIERIDDNNNDDDDDGEGESKGDGGKGGNLVEDPPSSLVHELMMMGFPESWCIDALREQKNDLILASAWIVDNLEDLSSAGVARFMEQERQSELRAEEERRNSIAESCKKAKMEENYAFQVISEEDNSLEILREGYFGLGGLSPRMLASGSGVAAGITQPCSVPFSGVNAKRFRDEVSSLNGSALISSLTNVEMIAAVIYARLCMLSILKYAGDDQMLNTTDLLCETMSCDLLVKFSKVCCFRGAQLQLLRGPSSVPGFKPFLAASECQVGYFNDPEEKMDTMDGGIESEMTGFQEKISLNSWHSQQLSRPISDLDPTLPSLTPLTAGDPTTRVLGKAFSVVLVHEFKLLNNQPSNGLQENCWKSILSCALQNLKEASNDKYAHEVWGARPLEMSDCCALYDPNVEHADWFLSLLKRSLNIVECEEVVIYMASEHVIDTLFQLLKTKNIPTR